MAVVLAFLFICQVVSSPVGRGSQSRSATGAGDVVYAGYFSAAGVGREGPLAIGPLASPLLSCSIVGGGRQSSFGFFHNSTAFSPGGLYFGGREVSVGASPCGLPWRVPSPEGLPSSSVWFRPIAAASGLAVFQRQASRPSPPTTVHSLGAEVLAGLGIVPLWIAFLLGYRRRRRVRLPQFWRPLLWLAVACCLVIRADCAPKPKKRLPLTRGSSKSPVATRTGRARASAAASARSRSGSQASPGRRGVGRGRGASSSAGPKQGRASGKSLPDPPKQASKFVPGLRYQHDMKDPELEGVYYSPWLHVPQDCPGLPANYWDTMPDEDGVFAARITCTSVLL
jgi:hypothetical protein